MSELTASEIKVGRTYSAKRQRIDGLFEPLICDRQVLWVDSFGITVQYDSPSVKNGKNYPKVSMEKFLKWADKDITDQMPKGEWRKG